MQAAVNRFCFIMYHSLDFFPLTVDGEENVDSDDQGDHQQQHQRKDKLHQLKGVVVADTESHHGTGTGGYCVFFDCSAVLSESRHDSAEKPGSQ